MLQTQDKSTRNSFVPTAHTVPEHLYTFSKDPIFNKMCQQEIFHKDEQRVRDVPLHSAGCLPAKWRHVESKVSYLVSWCFEPSQPQRITSGLIENKEAMHGVISAVKK